MRTLIVRDAMRIPIGRQGENEAQRVVWPDIVTGWAKLYGDGVFSLAVKRKGDAAPYPVTVTTENGALVWVPTNADTAVAGSGSCELSYTVDDVLAKSQTWSTEVYSSLTGEGETDPPEPYQSWVDQVVAVGAAAQTSADAAKADADRATALAAEVSKKAAQTAQDASDAAKAMEAAQTAQRLAEEAQSAAEAARTAAEAAQAAAETAATDAAGAQKDAETAQKAAQDAAAAAANTLESIQTLYQEMQTWARGVIQDVNAAGSAAAQSAQEAAGSASEASTSETNAKASEESAKASETAAQASKTAAAGSASAAANSAASASASASAASESAAAAAASETSAKASEEAANASETAAADSASAAQQSATSAAESAAVYDNVVADVNQLKQDVAAITPDDTAVDGKPWTSKKIVDSLCQPIEESGNPVQVYPVENYPLGVKVSLEPVQEGSGDPSPDNIRPITGRDSVTITHSNDVVSNDYNIALPETVYGGTLDVESGVLTVDRGYLSFDGTENWYLNRGRFFLGGVIEQGINNGSPYSISSHARYHDDINFSENGTFSVRYFKTQRGWVGFAFSNIDNVDDFKSYLAEQYAAGTPVQICYNLQQPYTIQLSTQQIAALSGVNTIYTDADGVIVTGAEDPKHTITELKNAIISLGGNV